jgi:ribosomal protein S27E
VPDEVVTCPHCHESFTLSRARRPRTKREAADEAYRKAEAQLVQAEQQDVFAGTPTEERYEVVPTVCPGCGRMQTIVKGWTPLSARGEPPVYPIQCGGCARTILVTQDAQIALRQAIARVYREKSEALKKPKRDTSGRATRGAG